MPNMLIKNKLNFKKYFGLTLLTTIGALLFARGQNEYIAILSIYASTILNQMMLLEAVSLMIARATDDIEYVNKLYLSSLVVGKILLLFGGLALGVHLMGKRVLIPLLNYVIQIFILALCVRWNKKTN